jgi:hypothetical protein
MQSIVAIGWYCTHARTVLQFACMMTISFKLSKELASRLDEEARSRHISRSAVLRECLEQQLVKPRRGKSRSCLDLMGDLIGSQPGPSDASTNPRYLESLGRDSRSHR